MDYLASTVSLSRAMICEIDHNIQTIGWSCCLSFVNRKTFTCGVWLPTARLHISKWWCVFRLKCFFCILSCRKRKLKTCLFWVSAVSIFSERSAFYLGISGTHGWLKSKYCSHSPLSHENHVIGESEEDSSSVVAPNLSMSPCVLRQIIQ